MAKKKPKVALVYDRVNKYGGAERVLQLLHQLYNDAPLYTAVYNPKSAPWADEFDVIPSFLNHLPLVKSHHEYFPYLMTYAFESFDFSPYDIIISITSAEAKSIITTPNQLHFCYMLTPTRYLWSHTHEYAGGWLKPLKQVIFSHMRGQDFVAAQRPDVIYGISQTVSQRIRKYYRREPNGLIYPPVHLGPPKNTPNIKKEHFLIVSRLVDYKRIDLAIEAFNQLPDQKLVIVGDGKLKDKLKAQANSNVRFVGQVSDSVLADFYQQAHALIMPQEEDFGIVSLEAQNFGVPVITVNKGGGSETVIDGQTGIHIDQNVSSLVTAIQLFQNHTWYDKTIMAHAQKFSESNFKSLFNQVVEDAWVNKNQ